MSQVEIIIRIVLAVLVMGFGLLGFVFVIWKRGRELHFDEQDLGDFSLSGLVGLLVGSKLLWMLLSGFSDFGLASVFRPTGVLGGGIWLMWWFAAKLAKGRRLELWQTLDVLGTALPILLIGLSLSSLILGSSPGIPFAYGIKFPGLTERRLPVQLIEIGFLSFIFWLAWWLENEYRTFSWYRGARSHAETGFIWSVVLALVGLVELVITLLRYPQFVRWGIRLDLVVAILVFLSGLFSLYHRSGWDLLDYFGLRRKK